MIPFDTLTSAWRAERARRLARHAHLPRIGESGLALGPMVVVAKRAGDRWGASMLAIDGYESRILPLLAVAYWRPVRPLVIDQLRRASKALCGRNPALAPILVAQAGLGRIDADERTAFRLFAAEKLLDVGAAPRELMKGLGLDPWPLDALSKDYDPDQPRVPAGQTGGGQWTSEGGNGADSASMENDEGTVMVAEGKEAGTTPDLKTVPGYRVQAISQGDWDKFRNALDAAGLPPEQKYIYLEIFAAEGGLVHDGSTVAGITQQALDSAKSATNIYGEPLYPDLAAAATPGDLTPRQFVTAYGAYFDAALHAASGADALLSVGDPRTAAAIADTLFRSGANGGAAIVQNAVSDVIGGLTPQERQQLGYAMQPIEGTHQLGYPTLGTIADMVQGGYADRLRSAIADLRDEQPYVQLPGERSRNDHFR